MVLTNQLRYLVDVKTMRKIYQIMCASQKVRTLSYFIDTNISHFFVKHPANTYSSLEWLLLGTFINDVPRFLAMFDFIPTLTYSITSLLGG